MLLKTSRRTFLKGLTLSGVAGSLGVWSFNARSSLSLPVAASLQGTQFDLTIGETAVNITGSERQAKTINGGLPGPVLRWKEGDTITLKVKNRLNEQTSIHWHGIILPANMDGVPGLSFMGIEPDDTYVYTFKVKQNGTYWYHSHSGLQEQEGVYGAIIIDAREPEPFAYDREHVVMLSDWTDENPHSLLKKLKKQSDYYNFNKPTVGSFFRDVNTRGLSATIADRKMWAEMKMNPTDLADVSGYTYTYLMNGQAPLKNWTGLFRPGEKIRLRFINGSAMTYFDIRIPGLKMTVVAADGQYVNPVTVDEFRIAVAETYDVIVEPQGEAYTIFAQSMDRTGYARGTLATREGLSAAVPPLDPRPLLTMEDMGMGGMGHDMARMDHSQMGGMDNSGEMMSMDGADLPDSGTSSAPMDHSSMAGMDHSRMEGAFRKLSDFSSDIAHELRTPVSNLMMQTQFALAKERDVSHYREILFANLEELKRLSRMTSDMLFLARSEHGLLRLDKHDVDLAAELNELRELFEPLADETGKTITVEGEGVVAGDSDMLRRAFSNLLSNAIKYSPDNTCTAIHLERDSDCVNVMITNTMSGQVPANLERLFDRFYRADSSRFYNTEGAGLGLSITRSIIHAHGGELSAEQQGREIVFKVRLLMD